MCTVALTIASALGSVWQGYAAKQSADAQAAVAEQNARIATQQGHDAVTRGGVEEGKMRRQLRKLIGKQFANAGASGIAVDSGSITDARLSSIDAMERDIDVNEMNAQRQRWGFDVQAVNYQNEASAARAAGNNAFTAGLIGGATSLLSLATPKIDEWFSKGVNTGEASYSYAANAGLARQQAMGNIGNNTASDIFSAYTPVADKTFDHFAAAQFGLDPKSLNAGRLMSGDTLRRWRVR